MIKYFMSPQGWLALTISLILGGLIGYWTNSQFANRKSMVFSTKSINYISAFQTKIDGFSALFDGKPIENLTTTQLLFLNNGNQTIDGNDITQINPLLIKANNPKVKILRVNIIKSDKVNNLKVTKKNNKFLINFDFLDKDDGSIIQIIHSGKIDEDVTFLGTIKGITKINKVYFTVKSNSIYWFSIIIVIPLIGLFSAIKYSSKSKSYIKFDQLSIGDKFFCSSSYFDYYFSDFKRIS